MRNKKQETERGFFIAMFIFATAYVILTFQHSMTANNTTLFAMSYQYGFISRGLIGTLWSGIDCILPGNQMTYKAVYQFSMIVTIGFYLLFLGVLSFCLNKSATRDKKNQRNLMVLLAVFVFPMFATEEVFGRLDVYLCILSLLAVVLLVKEKWEWLVVPICILCMLIHQGFVFTNANLILVLLFIKMQKSQGSKRQKYLGIFLITLVSISLLFLYFEFFSHHEGSSIFNEVVTAAQAVSPDGKAYNKSIVNHEILGRDVFEDEWLLHKVNYREFPAFLLLILPYLVIGIKFFCRLLTQDRKDKNKYLSSLALLLGSATIIPEMILKVDYGRYVFMTFFYYLMAVIALLAMGDVDISNQLQQTKENICKRVPVPQMLLIYPMFLMPMYDVVISPAVDTLANWLFWFIP